MEEKELEKKAPGEAEAENIPENGAGVENTAENAAGPAGASADGEDAPENGKEEKKEKKGLFGKKKDLRDTQIEELTDQLKRSMAEFDNYRKRTDKEKSAMYEIGARDVIEKILPVVDNFERGLATVPEDAKETPFAEGMEKIYKQLMKTLDDMGNYSVWEYFFFDEKGGRSNMRFFHSEEEAYDFIYQDALSFHQTSEKYGIKW